MVTTPDPLPALLAPFRDRPERAGLLTDFDGTLAPIVDDPASSAPLPGIADLLGRLAGRLALVAVVSGRPAAFLRDHLGGRGVELWGLYGVEWVEDGEVVVHPDARSWAPVLEEVADAADAGGPDGVLVERKGLSVVLHFRTRPELEDEARAWVDEAAAEHGLAVHPGRMSFELRPPLDRDKGSVVDHVAERCDAVCFMGDDVGDLSAFDALDRLAADDGHVLRVGVRSSEAPPELLERADLLVDGPEGAAELLAKLL